MFHHQFFQGKKGGRPWLHDSMTISSPRESIPHSSIDLSRRKRENKFDDAQASEANDALLNCYLGTH